MTRLCQHCATPYAEGSDVDGFCCAGCRQVYSLIHDEGLGDYYRWQDRAAQPLKDRALDDVDEGVFRRVQSDAEASATSGPVVFKVEGMSCMGCAWLIERLAANQAGLIQVESSLSAHTVGLQWRHGEFDLPAFATELVRFGYRLSTQPQSSVAATRLSPMTTRCLLTAVFAANALLLAAYAHYIGEAPLVHLLSLACLCFTLLLGAAPFCLAVYRAWKIRRWHSDWIPVLVIAGSVGYFGSLIAIGWMSLSLGTFFISLLVCILLTARVLSRRSWHS